MSPEPGKARGLLVLVVGPSGAGKDSIMRGARERLGPDEGVSFPRRVVTRPADASEDNDAASKEAFATASRRGDFALEWEAHGLRYAVPWRALDGLEHGELVVVNGSRTVVSGARRAIGAVRVALVTAPPAVLADRIRARGRDSDTVQRLGRDLGAASDIGPDIIIQNVGPLEAAVDDFLAFLRACRTASQVPDPALRRGSQRSD